MRIYLRMQLDGICPGTTDKETNLVPLYNRVQHEAGLKISENVDRLISWS